MLLVLSFRLNKRFDPLLKKKLMPYLDLVPHFTTRFLRTGIYAMYVAKKEWFGRNRPEVQAIDFREGVSRSTVILSWIYTINGAIVMLVMLIVGCASFLGLI